MEQDGSEASQLPLWGYAGAPLVWFHPAAGGFLGLGYLEFNHQSAFCGPLDGGPPALGISSTPTPQLFPCEKAQERQEKVEKE